MIKHCFDSAFFMGGRMISRKKWQLCGKAVNIKHRKKGLWLTIKGCLYNDSYSKLTTIECWLPVCMYDKKKNYLNKFDAIGDLVFEGKKTYFLTEIIV